MDTNTTPVCVADDDGRPCTREAVMLRPVALCNPHRVEVALAVTPGLLRDQLDAARHQTSAPAPRLDLVDSAPAASVEDLLQGVHDSVVYFLANGGRVKIGYTTNLKSRIGSLALRSDALLLAMQGGPDLERALHAKFARFRDGSTEWFELSPEIFRFIAAPHPSATGVAGAATGVAVAVGAASLAAQTAAVGAWLATEPGLTGAEVGRRLGVSDGYGRRVLRTARDDS